MASDVIRLICPNLKCRSILIAPSHARGRAVVCRACGIKVKVPAMQQAAPAKAATPAPEA